MTPSEILTWFTTDSHGALAVIGLGALVCLVIAIRAERTTKRRFVDRSEEDSTEA